MKSKLKIKIYKKPQPRRKDSFWFDGEIAKISLGKLSISIVAQGHIDVIFSPDEENYKNDMARKEARSRGYTDVKLNNLSNHDGWNNNNWFAFEINYPDGRTEWDEGTSVDFDDAIRTAKSIVKDCVTFMAIDTLTKK